MSNSIVILTLPGDYFDFLNYELLVIKKISKDLKIDFLSLNTFFYKGISIHKNDEIKTRDKILNSFFDKKIFFERGKIFFKNNSIKKNLKNYTNGFGKIFKDILGIIKKYRRIVFLINTYEELFVSLALINLLNDKNKKHTFIATGAFFRNTYFKNSEYKFILNNINFINIDLNFEYFLKKIKLKQEEKNTDGLISKKNYLGTNKETRAKDIFLNNNLIGADKNFFHDDLSPMITSYNCYYKKCSFCYENFINSCVNIKKIPSLVDEIEYLYRECGTRKIIFNDNFIHINYLLMFSKEILKRNIHIEWSAKTKFSTKFIDNKNCELLRKAGCKRLFMGIESYSKRMLEIYNKNIKIDTIIPTLRFLKSKNITTHVSFLFGFPGETDKDRQETLEFIKENLSIMDIIEVNLYMENTHTFESKKIYNKRLVDGVEKIREFITKQGKTPFNFY